MVDWRRKRRTQAVGVMVAATCMALLASECIVRWVRPQSTYTRLARTVGDFYAPCEFLPFTLRAGYRGAMPSMEQDGHPVRVTISSQGLRSPEVPRAKTRGVDRILFLGDSYTFGVYCDDTETYPAVLQELLRRRGTAAEVINAGYADGFSPDEHYAWLMNRGLSFEPDVVVYGFFVGNDIQGINRPGWAELDKEGLPRKISNPDMYADPFGRLRSRVNDSKTVGHEFVYRIPVLRESHFCILLNHVWNKLVSRHEPDSCPPNGGWGTMPFPMILQARTPPVLAEQEALFFRLLQGMDRRAKERGARFVVLMIPVNFQVEPDLLKKLIPGTSYSTQRNYFDEIKPKLESLHIEYIDLLARMRAADSETYFPRNAEVHFNSTGHRFAARVLEDYFATGPKKSTP